jgi:hypothetical protein
MALQAVVDLRDCAQNDEGPRGGRAEAGVFQ